MKIIPGKREDRESSRCQCNGKPLDAPIGAVSRRIDQVLICPLCGQQKAIEGFLICDAKMCLVVNVSVPEGKNETKFTIEEALDAKWELKVSVKAIENWYTVKIW